MCQFSSKFCILRLFMMLTSEILGIFMPIHDVSSTLFFSCDLLKLKFDSRTKDVQFSSLKN